MISTKRTLKIGEDFGIAYELFQKEEQKQGLDFFLYPYKGLIGNS